MDHSTNAPRQPTVTRFWREGQFCLVEPVPIQICNLLQTPRHTNVPNTVHGYSVATELMPLFETQGEPESRRIKCWAGMTPILYRVLLGNHSTPSQSSLVRASLTNPN